MSKTIDQLNQELDAPIPRSAVSQREGGNGRSLSYLAGHYVIDRLNKVLGPFNWASDIKSMQLVHSGTTQDRYGKDVYTVHYVATIRLVVQGPDGKATEHTDVGYGDGSDKANIGKAHELAVKEAVTDGLKRCAKNLGQSMGLALYDKDQPNVQEDAPAGKPAPAASTSKSAAAPSAPVSRPKAEAPHAARNSAEGAHSDRPKLDEGRDLVNRKIAATGKIIVSQGKDTNPGLKEKMLARYGVDAKEKLSDEQASDFLGYLDKVANGAA